MRQKLRENGLSLAMFGLFLLFLLAQSLSGLFAENGDRGRHGEPGVSYATYLRSGDFVEGVFENWESEFLQMGAFVLMTIYLRQKGSPHSKDLNEPVGHEEEPPRGRWPLPWPVRRGGLALAVYEHSLTLSLFALFVMSFALHAWGGAHQFNDEGAAHGQATVSVIGYMTTSQFWYQSFQNWQSEFLSVGVLIVLSIFLRERGSAESKPVESPTSATGQ